MAEIGILEIFFGPPWTMEERGDWADFLAHHGFDFYIYGPKADAGLRKKWREPWPPEYLTLLGVLSSEFRMRGLKFGVALSPYGVEYPVTEAVKNDLREKISTLTSAGVEIFGLFFDDMKSIDHLADMQLELLNVVMSATSAKILFCPSYYSTDPILDKVFGARPPDYLERLGREIPPSVEILWTGPKVISQDIPLDHLQEVTQLLKRKPFICDNLFANDGPKNCKFLKLKEFTRPSEALASTAGWSLNPMNQAALSQAMVLAAKDVFKNKRTPAVALESAIHKLCSPELADWVLAHREALMNQGLDKIEASKKTEMLQQLEHWQKETVAKEIMRWLRGDFIVGDECLTD